MDVQDYRMLKLPEVCRVTGLSRTAVYQTSDFPKPVKIGPRSSAWVEREVQAWCKRRIEARDHARPEPGHDA